jgi:hypothetical protein
MTTTIFTDRSRVETYQRCPRLRWLEYHQDGRGIAPAKKALPLCVGSAVHVGLATLLAAAIGDTQDNIAKVATFEDAAVAAALADFATHRSALALDSTEQSALACEIDPKDAGFNAQLIATAAELGMTPDDPALGELLARQRNQAAEFDGWLFNEQAALVEGLVRAYARRRLRPLLEEFEVLEVEREGDWELGSLYVESGVCHCGSAMEGHSNYDNHTPLDNPMPVPIRFMSRPDALLRSRADNSLYLLSYKTAATWDVRKARDAEHDAQGLSEGVEVERRLGEWWQQIKDKRPFVFRGYGVMTEAQAAARGLIPTVAMVKYLLALAAPPRILGIRYEYLLKGYRSEDKDLSARFGLRVWSQRSHLVRRYVATSVPQRGLSAYSVGDQCWSYDYMKDDGSSSKLAWQNWRSESAWEHGTVREWIDALDASTETMSAEDSTVGQEPRLLGYKGPTQSLGYTARHPLDEVFVAPMTVYRSDDQLRDWVEQVEAQETRVAEAVAAVDATASDEGERRRLLNVEFPMSRRACSYPSECVMTKVCYGGDDIRRDPLGSGLYRIRIANHQQEKDQLAATAKGE